MANEMILRLPEIDLAPIVERAIEDYVRQTVSRGMEQEIKRLCAAQAQEVVRSVDFTPIVAEAIRKITTALVPLTDYGNKTFPELVRKELSQIHSEVVRGER